jgi:uncharacterized protein Yka (UPF0111/DUF47 family)
MSVESADSPKWISKVFAPRTNFYSLLNEQAQKTLEGIVALQDWIDAGAPGRCQIVRDCEHQADKIVLDLEQKLVESFITPFDREDIYDLSARLDEVINAAKATVREIEALEIATDDQLLKEMVATIVEGTRCLSESFYHLGLNLEAASQEAYLARKSENRASRIYREAVRQLFALDDFKKIQKTKEVYRCLIAIAERIDEVGVKLLHVIIKLR